MSHVNRRRFLKTSAAFAATSFAISGTKSSGNILGANDRIRLAVAGLHGRGKSHMGEFAKMKGVEIAYLVDPHRGTYKNAVKQVAGITGREPETATDIRSVLEDKSLNAVSIATPNHWHALMTIWACEAGKDVYVEKPCSHNVHEGRIAVEAATKHKRIVQHGTQGRSSGTWAKIAAVIQGGTYGKLRVARGICYKKRGTIGFKKPQAAPSELDFNIWLGPAGEQKYHANLVHYNWHWFWDFGNGDIGNQGVHQMDIARWGIPGATLPKSVASIGGRFGYKDQGQTANTQITTFDYGETQLIFEVRGLVTKNNVDDLFEFDDGVIKADGRFYRKNGAKGEPLPDVKAIRGPGGGNHFANFIAGVKSRKTSDLNAGILEGHYSSALCHLANISYRLGEPVSFDSKKRPFGENTAANETAEKTRDHLAERGVTLVGQSYVQGPTLKFDANTEQFVGNEKANALLTREYRKAFAVPTKIG